MSGQNTVSSLYLIHPQQNVGSIPTADDTNETDKPPPSSADQFEGIFESNSGYVEEMYSRYNQSPNSVTPEWRAYFAGFKGGFAACLNTFEDLPLQSNPVNGTSAGDFAPRTSSSGALPSSGINVEVSVYQLTRAFQKYGHFAAKLDPLGITAPETSPLFDPKTHGIGPTEMQALTAVGVQFGWAPMTVSDYLDHLNALFCGPVGIETEHLATETEKTWIDNRINRILTKPDPAVRQALCEELAKADAFEKTLATKYLGQKRFSSEGADTQITALESAMDHAASLGVKAICMGKAHRGRLNVLINVAQKPLKKLFAEFDGRKGPGTFGDGDVKYHCGWETDRNTRSGHPVRVSLSFNPSHLEFVDPTVLGECRAIGDTLYNGDRSKVLPILTHGDAAFAGQGVVYETLQMMAIDGQKVGGCLHLILNNQVGFTTNPEESRSTRYCSDLGKAFGSPIFHVNADAVDELHQVVSLAVEFRQTFGKDVIIDLVCFRRHGHNETDEPVFTQPAMYRAVKDKKAPYEDYAAKLTAEDPQLFPAAKMEAMYQSLRDQMTRVYDDSQANPDTIDIFPPTRRQPGFVHAAAADMLNPVDTRVSVQTLIMLGQRALEMPAGFSANPKLERIVLADRREMLQGNKPIDWGMGEFLAYASLLAEGHSVRLCGQDAGRGTFSHRHAVLVDSNDETKWLGLSQVSAQGSRIEIVDSLLSETAAMGFEYGYSSRNHNALTIWEGQFGDFCNGAQVIIDQFLVSGESKWGQMQGLVLFLPHGYEGQGPEHSSGRLERFLQLAAEGNIQVCCLTSAAQLFHALRRQVKRNFRKPLIIMTPKSFLRSPRAASPLASLENGRFEEVIGDERSLNASDVERIVLCSGKVALDALAHAEATDNATRLATDKTAIIRIEQLYPLHTSKLKEALAKYPKAKSVFWLQEEPQNMGAYYTVRDDLDEALRGLKLKNPLRFIGRSKRASPAVGSPKSHAKEFVALMDAVFLAQDTTLIENK